MKNPAHVAEYVPLQQPAARLQLLGFLGGLAPAATLGWALRGGLTNQFRAPNRSNEFLQAVIVEIDGGSIVVGFRDDAHAVLIVTDGLPFHKDLHCPLPI
jgi:hypothetical protein